MWDDVVRSGVTKVKSAYERMLEKNKKAEAVAGAKERLSSAKKDPSGRYYNFGVGGDMYHGTMDNGNTPPAGTTDNRTETDTKDQNTNENLLRNLSQETISGADYLNGPQINGKSHYDIMRNRARVMGALETQQALDQIAGNMAMSGFGKGSGMLESMQGQATLQHALNTSTKIGDIGIKEGEAREKRWDSERTRSAALTKQALDSLYAKDRMTLQEQIDSRRHTTELLTDAAFAKGKAGEEISPEDLANMSEEERAAYEAGKSGKTYEDYTADRDREEKYAMALIATLDPNKEGFEKALNKILNAIYPGSVPEETNLLQQEPINLGGHKGGGTYQFNIAPVKGASVEVGGKKYTAVSGALDHNPSGFWNDTNYVLLQPDDGGPVVALVPEGCPSKAIQALKDSLGYEVLVGSTSSTGAGGGTGEGNTPEQDEFIQNTIRNAQGG